MALLYKTVNLIQEKKKQAMIDELVKMGIFGDGGKNLQELDYYEIRRLLAAARVRLDAPENEWF
jgi:hypothetical protein